MHNPLDSSNFGYRFVLLRSDCSQFLMTWCKILSKKHALERSRRIGLVGATIAEENNVYQWISKAIFIN
jgi:hypothetical protein